MTRFGLDSTSEVPVSAHRQVGSSVSLRYTSRYNWKVITPGEFSRARAGGIAVALVFEDGAANARGGYAQGKADGEFGLHQAYAILGAPPHENACMRFAVDYDTNGHPSETDSYFDGVAAVWTREHSGPYGSFEVCAHQAARGFKQLWQTYAWSAGRFFNGASLYQYSNDHYVGGVGCDFNHIYGDDFGQWDRQKPPPPDPHHYSRFPDVGLPWHGHTLWERKWVVEYDRLRPHPVINHRRLVQLRNGLKLCADRQYYLAHFDPKTGKKLPHDDWHGFWKGWRFQECYHRGYQGRKVV